MKTELVISEVKIEECTLVETRILPDGMGAAVYFMGAVRGTEEGRAISGIEYEVFLEMAEHQFDLIFEAVGKRWPVQSIRLMHRIGRVEVGEASVWVEVIAPHRAEAFAACQFIIDEMKRTVPIWKKAVV